MRNGWHEIVEWIVGALLGCLALGQALRPGAILNLDFVLLPHAPVPDGVWGLGPELPRRTPLLLPIAWLDPLVGSVAAGKALVALCLAGAFVGASRLAARAGQWRWLAGLLYAASPFTLTRVAVGHLFVLAALAMLPWVVRDLLDPDEDLGRTYRGALVLGLTGVMGGLLAGATLTAGIAGRRLGVHRTSRLLLLVVVAQLPWLLPGIAAWGGGARLATSEGFATDLGGTGGALRLLAGHGFWQRGFQVGHSGGVVVPVLGVGLAVAAFAGHRRLDPDLRRLGPLAAIAAVLVTASGWSPLRGLYQDLTSLPGGAALREGQRLLVLVVLWMAVAVAQVPRPVVGAARPGREVWRVAPLAMVVALVAPGVWGAGGQMRSVDLPDGWEAARDLVRQDPGPVLALPWFQYLRLDAADGRNVLNPLPLWLGGDVLRSSDPRLPGQTALERGDPREPHAAALVAASLRGDPIGRDLARLGVRWAVVLLDGDLLRGQPLGVLHSEALRADPGLRRRIATDAIEVYEVRAWPGAIATSDGSEVPSNSILGPFTRVAASGPATWARPGADGWMRGWRAAEITANGQVALPSGSSLVWYWPSVLVLLGYLLSAVLALLSHFLPRFFR